MKTHIEIKHSHASLVDFSSDETVNFQLPIIHGRNRSFVLWHDPKARAWLHRRIKVDLAQGLLGGSWMTAKGQRPTGELETHELYTQSLEGLIAIARLSGMSYELEPGYPAVLPSYSRGQLVEQAIAAINAEGQPWPSAADLPELARERCYVVAFDLTCQDHWRDMISVVVTHSTPVKLAEDYLKSNRLWKPSVLIHTPVRAEKIPESQTSGLALSC